MSCVRVSMTGFENRTDLQTKLLQHNILIGSVGRTLKKGSKLSLVFSFVGTREVVKLLIIQPK